VLLNILTPSPPFINGDTWGVIATINSHTGMYGVFGCRRMKPLFSCENKNGSDPIFYHCGINEKTAKAWMP